MVSVLPETVTAAACLWVRLPGILLADILSVLPVSAKSRTPAVTRASTSLSLRPPAGSLECRAAASVGSQHRPVRRASAVNMRRRDVAVADQRSVLQLQRVADFRIAVNLAVRDVVVYVFAGLRTPRSEACRAPERKVYAGIRVGLTRRIRGRLSAIHLSFPSIIGASARDEQPQPLDATRYPQAAGIEIEPAGARGSDVEKRFAFSVDEVDVVATVDAHKERGVVVARAVALEIPFHRVDALGVPGRVQEHDALGCLACVLSRGVRAVVPDIFVEQVNDRRNLYAEIAAPVELERVVNGYLAFAGGVFGELGARYRAVCDLGRRDLVIGDLARDD